MLVQQVQCVETALEDSGPGDNLTGLFAVDPGRLYYHPDWEVWFLCNTALPTTAYHQFPGVQY